jgi:hypothetical protein
MLRPSKNKMFGNTERSLKDRDRSGGFVIWLFGYLSAAHASAFDWDVATPSWIASFVPNLEAELGLALMFANMIPIYWRAEDGSARNAGCYDFFSGDLGEPRLARLAATRAATITVLGASASEEESECGQVALLAHLDPPFAHHPPWLAPSLAMAG